VGASSRDILIQFLFESIVITLVGGSIGILLGILGAKVWKYLLTHCSNPNISFDWFSCFCLVGLFFGVYPAVKASR